MPLFLHNAGAAASPLLTCSQIQLSGYSWETVDGSGAQCTASAEDGVEEGRCQKGRDLEDDLGIVCVCICVNVM